AAGVMRLSFAAGLVGELEEARAEHGGEREAHQHRHEDGDGGGDAEGEEKSTDAAGHEGDGEEYDDEREGGGHDGQGDFFGGAKGSIPGAQAFFFHPAEDVFVNDHGVVDDDADGQHHGEHGDVVEGEAKPVHHHEGADQRHG